MIARANVHLLPIKSDALKSDRNILSINNGKLYNPFKNQYYGLYMTLPQSDLAISKIKDGEWYYAENGDLKKILQVTNGLIAKTLKIEKIIASNQFITNDIGMNSWILPSIPLQYIEYFIDEYNKGNVIKNVEIELEKTTKYKDFAENSKHQEIIEVLKINQLNEIFIVMNKSDRELALEWFKRKIEEIWRMEVEKCLSKIK